MLLNRPDFKLGALLMGVGELFGDKMKSAPDRTGALGLLAQVSSAGIAGAALDPPGRENVGALTAIATAVPLAYVTLAGRKRAMARLGQTRSGLIEDALVIAAGVMIVALSVEQVAVSDYRDRPSHDSPALPAVAAFIQSWRVSAVGGRALASKLANSRPGTCHPD